MEARRKKLIIGALILLCVGALYAVFVRSTGLGIPCVFRMITGLKCPGCGVTGMFLALFRLNFKRAFNSNAVLLCMIPAFVAVAARMAYLYVKRGSTRDRAVNIAVYCMIGVLIVWGVVRNII